MTIQISGNVNVCSEQASTVFTHSEGTTFSQSGVNDSDIDSSGTSRTLLAESTSEVIKDDKVKVNRDCGELNESLHQFFMTRT